MYSCETEVFEIEQILYIKIDLALHNLPMLIRHKTRTTNQPLLLEGFEIEARDRDERVGHMTKADGGQL